MAIPGGRAYASRLVMLLVGGVACLCLGSGGPMRTYAGERDAPAANPVFGVGWTADSLANLEIGRFRGRMVSYRFCAVHSGSVGSLRVFFIFRKIGPGEYADGNGGSVLIELVSDDGTPSHFPSHNLLGTAVVKDPLAQWNREVRFSKPVQLEAGKLYHVVFSNPSPDPANNYVSVDDLYTTAGGRALQPSAESSDLSVLLKPDGNSSWQEKYQQAPVISICYDDGYRQGQAYIDVKHNGIEVKDNDAVREVFTAGGADRLVSVVAVRFQPLSQAGHVKLVLASEDGVTVKTVSLNLSSGSNNYAWHISQLGGTITLRKGVSYSLTLETQAGGSFRVSPLQKGTQYGFEADTLFTEGHCEEKAGPLWIGCMKRSDLDLPFYFR